MGAIFILSGAGGNLHDGLVGIASIHKDARLAGIEPATSAFAGLRSVRLSYKRTRRIKDHDHGAEGEI